MQQLMRHKGKKFTWNNAPEDSLQRKKRELCEASVLSMPIENWMYVLRYRRFSGRDFWHIPSRARMERKDRHETNIIQEQGPDPYGDEI